MMNTADIQNRGLNKILNRRSPFVGVGVEKVAGRRALSIIHIYGMTGHNGLSLDFMPICGEFTILKTKWLSLIELDALRFLQIWCGYAIPLSPRNVTQRYQKSVELRIAEDTYSYGT
jgi:hypothetical protein